MIEKIESLENKLDALSIEVEMNTCHLKTINQALIELSTHLLSEQESKAFQCALFDTLYQKTSDKLLHDPTREKIGLIQTTLFELKSYVEQSKKALQIEG